MSTVFPFDSAYAASDTPSPAAELRRRWRLGQRPQIEAFLAERPPESPVELAAIARVDLRQRWRQGERPRADDYFARFPPLRANAELAIDLIYSEFLAREESGEEPQVADILASYPEFAEELGAQIRLHRALGAEPATSSGEQESTVLEAAAGLAVGTRNMHSGAGPDYEILEEIGRGGMGIVYRARQLGLNRLVALKMVRAADIRNPELLDRFRAEAEAVARLHHPNIVQIYDYGEYEGLPYLALELVEGESLAARLKGQAWPARESAQVVATLARALQFAHEQGIVHRDLKPANILVAWPTGNVSPARLTIKITDFGLAKVFREGEESHTLTGTIVGTPCYMAPEQARGQSSQIGPTTDVYALGAILYELVTGQPPFKAATAIETLHQLLTRDVDLSGRHLPRLPRDLATIMSKCLHKDPQQRYVSAGAMAEDLERFLQDRPIRARRTTAAEHGWRWCRRNPVLALLTGTIAGLLVTVAAVSTLSSARLRQQLNINFCARSAETDARKLAEVRLWESYLAEINAGHGSRQLEQRAQLLVKVDLANELLNKIGRTPERVLQLRNATIAALALPGLHQDRTLEADGPFYNIDLSIAADRYVVATTALELIVYQLATSQELLRIKHDNPEGTAAISADGRYVAVSGNRGAQVWQLDGEKAMLAWEAPEATYVSLSPDSSQAAVSDRAGMRLVDLPSGQTVRALGRGAARSQFSFHGPSRRIAVCTYSGVQIIDLDTGGVVVQVLNDVVPRGAWGIAWHPQGDLIAVSGLADGVELWDVATKRLRATYPHAGYIPTPCFNNSGELLLTFDPWSFRLRVWNIGTGQEVLRDPFFSMLATDTSASPGDYLIRLERDGRLKLCHLSAGLATSPFPPLPGDMLAHTASVALSPDGQLLAVGRPVGFELWDLTTRRRTVHEVGPHCAVKFDARGNLFVACRWGLYRWPRRESMSPGNQAPAHTIRFGPPEKLSEPLADALLDLTADGNLLVVKARSGWQLIRPGATDGPLKLAVDQDARGVSISPDGRWVAVTNWHVDGANIFDSATGQRVVTFPPGPHCRPLFSPDGQWLATTPGGVCVWRVEAWTPVARAYAQGTTPSGLGIAFSPDSRALAIGQPQGMTRLVDPATGKDWAVLRRPDMTDGVNLTFTPEQSRLIEGPGGDRGALRIWDLVEIRKELAQRGLDWPGDVLQPASESAASADRADVEVILEIDEKFQQEAGAELLKEARNSKGIGARDLLERAIRLDPENAAAHNELSWLLTTGLAGLRDPTAALTHARRAVELEASKHEYLNTLGVALYRTGQLGEAIAVLQRAWELSPPEQEAYDLVFLALCHAAEADWPAANDYFARATRAVESQHSSLPPGTRDELNRFLNEARAAGLPR